MSQVIGIGWLVSSGHCDFFGVLVSTMRAVCYGETELFVIPSIYSSLRYINPTLTVVFEEDVW